MTVKMKIAAVAMLLLGAGCASQKTASNPPDAPAAPATSTASAKAADKAPSGTPGARTVKSRNGKFNGEIIGTVAPKSKFSKLEIGMTMREVNKLIGTPDDMLRHETGKRWIPFYYGNDAQRLRVLYQNEGCLIYTGGNVFGGGDNELIGITVDTKGACLG